MILRNIVFCCFYICLCSFDASLVIEVWSCSGVGVIVGEGRLIDILCSVAKQCVIKQVGVGRQTGEDLTDDEAAARER